MPDRSTGDLVILLVAATLCASILLTGAGIVAIELIYPDSDLSKAVAAFTGLLNTLLGLLAGYLIGRTRGVGRNDD